MPPAKPRSRFKTVLAIVGALVAIAAFAALAWWGYERYAVSRRGLDLQVTRSDYPVRGIDISHHNGVIDFSAVKADSIDFVFIKATDGVGDLDANFVKNCRSAKAAGLKVGAYHFFRTHRGGRQQAEALLDAISGLELDLPLAIDIEEDSHSRGNAEDVVPRIRTMLHELNEAGYRTILYANYDQFKAYIDGNFSEVDLWLATSREPSYEFDPRTLWQFSHHGKVSGVSGDVDMNAFIGSSDDFAAWSRGARLSSQTQ